jgi:multiple sugar transport system permease protein
MRRQQLGPLAAALRHAVLLGGAVFMLAPFVWMVSTSLKPKGEILSATLSLLPTQSEAVRNYTDAVTQVDILQVLLNGVIVTAMIFMLQIIVNLPCAYALAKLRFRGRSVLFALVLLCLLIPHHAIAIPVYIMFYQVGILNTYAALILPFSISVFGIFLMRQFFMTVPNDLIDAARMDGMSEFSIVWRVMAPTAVPAIVAFGIFSVVAHWNDYFWPLVVVGDKSLFTPPLAIAQYRLNESGTEYGPLMAGATVIILPLVVAFLVAQRRFIEGITFTGMKH